jgi:thioesterase domain-containing protein
LRPVVSPWVLARFAGNLLYRLGRMVGWSHAQRREFCRWKWRQLRKHWRRAAPNFEDLMLSDDVFDVSAYTPAQRQLWEIHARAYAAYQTQPYDGPVTLLRSRGHQFWCSFDRYYGWRELVTGTLTMRIVPGAHETILREPHVESVARTLTTAMAVAR